MRDTDLATIWIYACLLGGLIFVAVGPRAAGLALWGAVIGAFIGFNTAGDLDETPYLAMVGASAGCFGGGLLGLMWKSSASAVALRACGLGTLVVGVLSTWAISTQSCPAIRFPKDCIYELNPRWLALFAFDAAWIAALCFIQAAQSNRVSTTLRSVRRRIVEPGLRCAVCRRRSAFRVHDPARTPTSAGCFCSRHAREYVIANPGSGLIKLRR
jgi:hypothetical protein